MREIINIRIERPLSNKEIDFYHKLTKEQIEEVINEQKEKVITMFDVEDISEHVKVIEVKYEDSEKKIEHAKKVEEFEKELKQLELRLEKITLYTLDGYEPVPKRIIEL